MNLGKSCTGCGACSLICSRGCIEMIEDRLGQLKPKIDKKKCIGCGVCELRCPQIVPMKYFDTMNCYVAWSRYNSDLTFSASGGVCAVIAREALRRGGIFYGCDYDENGDLHHFAAKSEDELFKMQSSKYSRSNSYVCFNEILEHLKLEHFVVFVGTPCQVAGLLRFLNKTYDNLITIDLVCHGTPPNTYLKQHINELGITFPVSQIRFRGEYDQCLTIRKKENIVYKKNFSDDFYFSSFYQNIISYDSCYFCQYAQPKRISDITVGDFWGLGKLQTIEASSSRPSLIMINTLSGQLFFDSVSELFNYEKRETKEAISGNGRLNHPPGRSFSAKCFQKIYSTHLFRFHHSIALTHSLNDAMKKIKRKLSGKHK